jgi:hypothetical protein
MQSSNQFRFPPWTGIFFKLARCGYTLRVTSQYSPEYIIPTQNWETNNLLIHQLINQVISVPICRKYLFCHLQKIFFLSYLLCDVSDYFFISTLWRHLVEY